MVGQIFRDENGHVFDDEFEEWLTEQSGAWVSPEEMTDLTREAVSQIEEITDPKSSRPEV